jgi:hypothetical protein
METARVNQDEIDAIWSRSVANLAVAALLNAKLIKSEDLDRGAAIVAEEILVRLALQDRPDQSNWRYKSN